MPLSFGPLAIASIIGLIVFALEVEYGIILCFCSIIWLGEGFHFAGRLPVSPHVLCFSAVLLKCSLIRGPHALADSLLRNRLLLMFSCVFMAALVWGVGDSADSEVIKQDATPILYMIAVYAVVAATPSLNMQVIINGIVWLSALAVFKVLYLYLIPVGPTWINDWQANAEIGNGPLDSRIILRGADVLFFVAAAFQIGAVLVKPRALRSLAGILVTLMLGLGMYFSATRSNWIGLAVALLVELAVIAHGTVTASKKRSNVLFAAAVFTAIILALSVTTDYSPLEKIRLRFEDRDRATSVRLRIDETRSLFEVVGSSFVFGRGLGSQYDDPMTLYGKTTGFSHNGYLFLYLKMGIVGVLIYCAILWRLILRFRTKVVLAPDSESAGLDIGFIGAIVCLCVLSLSVNKTFAVSGAAFIGLALGGCQQQTNRSQRPSRHGVMSSGMRRRVTYRRQAVMLGEPVSSMLSQSGRPG